MLLHNKSGISNVVEITALNTKLVTLATKVELKAEQGKIVHRCLIQVIYVIKTFWRW